MVHEMDIEMMVATLRARGRAFAPDLWVTPLQFSQRYRLTVEDAAESLRRLHRAGIIERRRVAGNGTRLSVFRGVIAIE